MAGGSQVSEQKKEVVFIGGASDGKRLVMLTDKLPNRLNMDKPQNRHPPLIQFDWLDKLPAPETEFYHLCRIIDENGIEQQCYVLDGCSNPIQRLIDAYRKP